MTDNTSIFRAAVLFNLKEPLRVIDVLIPKLNAGQVLIKILYAGFCHSQLMEIDGYRGDNHYLPHMLGHEGVGEVVEVGQGVTKVKLGEKVVLTWIKSTGADISSTKYKTPTGMVINAGAVTTFSEFAVISENRCVPLPEGIPENLGVLLGCALPTGAGIVFNTLKPKFNSNIAIYGLGGVGFSAFLAARLFEPAKLIVVDTNNDKLNFAQGLGATHLINPQTCDPVTEIKRITDGLGVDYSIEAAGLTSTIEQAFLSVRNGGGQCVFASHPPHGHKITLDPHHLISGKTIRGTWGGECLPDRDIPIFSHHYKQNKLPIDLLISKEYQLHDINQAKEDLQSKKIVRGLIRMH